jgi:hypothetical protein
MAHPASYETRPTVCSNCSVTFSVLLVNRNDAHNPAYMEFLRNEIERDCDAGMHKEEYQLTADLLGK